MSDVYYNNEGLRILASFRERGHLPDDAELEAFVLDRMKREVCLISFDALGIVSDHSLTR